MQTPNPQVVHARKCVNSIEDSIHRMEATITVRLMAGWETTAEEKHLSALHGKLGEFRVKLEELEALCPEP